MANPIDLFWLGALATSTFWSAFFSLFQQPRIRVWRNLGVLAGFVLGAAMAVALPWQEALATWALMGVCGGAFYMFFELVAYLRLEERTSSARPRPGHLFHGLFAWPIMLPEAVEYLLAEMGVLKPAPEAETGT